MSETIRIFIVLIFFSNDEAIKYTTDYNDDNSYYPYTSMNGKLVTS